MVCFMEEKNNMLFEWEKLVLEVKRRLEEDGDEEDGDEDNITKIIEQSNLEIFVYSEKENWKNSNMKIRRSSDTITALKIAKM